MTTTSITVIRTYPHPPEHVFRAWTDPELLRRWYVPVDGWVVGSAEVVPGVGGSYAVSFGPPPDGDAYRETGTYTVFDPPHCLETHGTVDGGEAAGEPGRIRVDFVAVDGGCEVTVVETDLSPAGAAEHEEGWSVTLEHLAAALG